MISLIGVSEAEKRIAEYLQQQRVALGMTQKTLSERSGVNVFTLRKFEQKGLISLESLLKISLVLGVLDNLVEAVKPTHQPFLTIDDVLAAQKKKARKRGKRK